MEGRMDIQTLVFVFLENLLNKPIEAQLLTLRDKSMQCWWA
jgi:hypothetical protein